MSNDGRIHPSRHVVMRLPDTDASKDPWTGAARETGRNLEDDAPITEDVTLLPPLGKTPAQVDADWDGPIRPEDYLESEPAERSDRPLQFSIGDALVLMIAAAVSLGAARVVPPAIFSIAAGLSTLVFLWVTHERRMSGRSSCLITAILLTSYVLATATAVLESVWPL